MGARAVELRESVAGGWPALHRWQALRDAMERRPFGVHGPELGWLLSALTLTIVLAVPFFLVDVPPVLDYPNHLARYFVLAHPDDPILSRMYQPHWGILPNIGMDVIGAALLKVTSVHVGGRLVLALSLFAPVIGVVAYSRAAFGRFSYWSLASGLAAYNGIFFLGFMNFLLSVGLAFVAGAAWIALRRHDRWLLAVGVGAIVAAVVFLCHIFGALLFALLIGSAELARLQGLRRAGMFRVREGLRTIALCAVTLGPALALYLAGPLSDGQLGADYWVGHAKFWQLLTAFMTYSVNLTLLTGVAAYAFVILIWRDARLAPGATLVLVVLGVAYVATPFYLKGGGFVDARLALMMGLVVFAMVEPRPSALVGKLAGLAFAILIAVRTDHVASRWIHHRLDLADLRAAIAHVEPGSRVLFAHGRPGYITKVEYPERALPLIYRVDGNLAALLVIERRAFWPLMFASPNQQPLTVRPPYDRISDPLMDPVDWPVLRKDDVSAEDLSTARYLRDWRANFDDVLLIDPPTPLDLPRGLVQIYAGPYVNLFRVRP